ncbi:MAG: Gfo/Idh/MocA family oxidoreductase [Phycisphaeraceae bacterium]|nr:Gfo/Idh/MocA family oxidoreductase [Phycisphaeraceae bacterium]
MKKDDRRLRIGVLGCGPISQFAHFDACRKARNAELYAICDRAEDLVQRMAAVHQPAKTYGDFAQMLADPRVDAVIVAVADQFHVPLCKQAIIAGKPVLVEKPLGVSVEECDQLAALVKQTGKLLQIGNMKRFDPGIAYAHQFIREEMGQMLALKAWYCDSTYRYTMTDNLQPIPVASANVHRPAGNPKADKRRYFMLTHGSHLLDTARFLGGDIAAVRARLVEKFGAYCWFIDVEYADGSIGSLDLTIAVRMDFHEGFQIYGEHGSVIGKTYLPWFFKSSDVECFSTKDGKYHRPLGEDAHFYKLQVEAFADSILCGKLVRGATAEDGAAALRAMVAVARSVETGQRIALADATGAV